MSGKVKRDGKGRFLPGTAAGPGNPRLRRLGSLQRAVTEAITPEDISRVLQTLRDLALSGDVGASKVLLERVLGKPTTAADASEFGGIQLGPINSIGDLTGAFQSVLGALSKGEIEPSAASQVVGILELTGRALERSELEARVSRLEQEQPVSTV